MSPPPRPTPSPPSRIILITGLGGLSLACGGVGSGDGLALPCGPLAAAEGACLVERQCLLPGQASACGINGYECRDGQWREVITYCNPPPQPPSSP